MVPNVLQLIIDIFGWIHVTKHTSKRMRVEEGRHTISRRVVSRTLRVCGRHQEKALQDDDENRCQAEERGDQLKRVPHQHVNRPRSRKVTAYLKQYRPSLSALFRNACRNTDHHLVSTLLNENSGRSLFFFSHCTTPRSTKNLCLREFIPQILQDVMNRYE